MSLNLVVLDGNLGADAEIRSTSTGVPVLNCRLATHEYYYDADGKRHKRTEWHSVAAFGEVFGKIAPYLVRGRGVLVKGKLVTNRWAGKDGVERQKAQIRADSIDMHPMPERRDNNDDALDFQEEE